MLLLNLFRLLIHTVRRVCWVFLLFNFSCSKSVVWNYPHWGYFVLISLHFFCVYFFSVSDLSLSFPFPPFLFSKGAGASLNVNTFLFYWIRFSHFTSSYGCWCGFPLHSFCDCCDWISALTNNCQIFCSILAYTNLAMLSLCSME